MPTLETILAALREATREPLTKKALAAHCGVRQDAVSRWLRGAVPSPKHLLRIMEWIDMQKEEPK